MTFFLFLVADVRGRNDLRRKIKTTDDIYSLRDGQKREHKNILLDTDLRSLKSRRVRKTGNINGFTNTRDLFKDTSKLSSSKCKHRKPLRLVHQRKKESSGVTRTLIVIKGNQEISREYIKQHHAFKPVLRALKRRIENLKARKNGEMVNMTSVDTKSLRYLKTLPKLYLVRSKSRDTEGGKKQDVLSTAYTEVTDVRTSSDEVIPHWDVLGTIHSYKAPKKFVIKPLHKEKLPDPYEEPPSSSLPLYDDRILKKVTSGLKIFVNDVNNETKQAKHFSNKALSGVTPSPSSGLHDVTFGDVTSLFTTDKPASTSTLTNDEVTEGNMSSENDDITSSKNLNDKSSISIEELFNDDDSKSSTKIDELLSDDKTTDALAKEIANLLTDEPQDSSENPKASPNDLAIITDDAPVKQKAFRPITDVTPVSSEEAVSSAQKASPLTISTATQQCLAKRGLGSTDCSVSMICCSACCPLGKFSQNHHPSL